MLNKMDKNFVSKLFLIVLLTALILLLRLFWVFLSAMVLALLIASVFYPLYSLTDQLNLFRFKLFAKRLEHHEKYGH